LGQVLDSECDEPPNIRTFLTVVILVVTLVTPRSSASPLPAPYLATIKLLPYPVTTESGGSYAVIETSLSTPLDIFISSVTLGISADHCLTQPHTQIPLNLDTAVRKASVDSRVTTIPLILPEEDLANRKLSFCLSLDYVRQDKGGQVISTGWAQPHTQPLEREGVDTNYVGGNDESLRILERRRRQSPDFPSEENATMVYAMLLEDTHSKKSYNDMGVISVTEHNDVVLFLVGQNLENMSKVKFTTANNTFGGECKGAHGESHFQSSEFSSELVEDRPGFSTVLIPGGLAYHANSPVYYLCVKDAESGEYIHQGFYSQLQIEMGTLFMPIWLMIIFCCVLLCLSGLFSGLNLGLMSLDQTELQIVMSTGTEQEKKYANDILPIRNMGNFLLCSILLGNVLVNNTLTIFLDTLTGGGGTVAVIGATLGIVIFGEIIPQAICSRHGLAVGSKTIILTKFFMAITSPLSFPISKILDCILGSEIGTVYNRERLMELLRVTNEYTDLEKTEMNMVTGALVLKQKSVKDVMTHLDDCYMLPIETLLNFETVSEIKDQGYSRIPVYDGERVNIVHILFAKDLLFIDPDDEKPIEEVCKFYKNEVNVVYQDTILTDMFDEFKSGEKGHMAVVQEVNNDGDGDPYYETVGLVTIEDIIEEIIQQEINDETDVVIDNKSKKKRKRERYKKDADFKMFLGTKTHHRVVISPQMSLAIFQFLTTSVRAFSPEHCSRRILQKLLGMDVYRELKLTKPAKGSNNNNKDDKADEKEGILMTKGKVCDFFVLILEGRVEVTIGKEEHKFQEGPFSWFGEQMLEQALKVPSSPMVNGGNRGTTHSVSMHSSVNQEAKSAPNLKKTTTQTHLSSDHIGKKVPTDSSLPLPLNKAQSWIPDYTLRAITDLLYLKVRKNTYMVAIKASRMNNMNSESGGLNMKDDEIEDVLMKVIENDADFLGVTPNVMSPDKMWNGGIGQSMAGTPTDFRRESIRSSLSMMKAKLLGGQLLGRSTTSIGNKDDFWDGMANPALTRSGEDLSDLGSTLNSTAHGPPAGDKEGPASLPLNSVRKELQRDISDPTTRGALPDIEGRIPQISEPGMPVVGSAATVISVRGSGGGSTGDRTSVLHTEHPVS
jgi:metal transporter CNNM